MTTPTPHGAMPELPHIPPGDCIPYDAIRYVAGYPASYVQRYATEYAKLCLARAAIQQAAGAVPEGLDKVDLIMQLAEDYADEAINHGLYAPATYEARDRLRSTLSSPRATVKDAPNHGLVMKHGQVNHGPDSGHLSAGGVSEARLWELRREAKEDPRCADQHWFILFARAAIAEARIAQSPELTCWFGKCTTVEACADDGCKTLAASPTVQPDSGHLGAGWLSIEQAPKDATEVLAFTELGKINVMPGAYLHHHLRAAKTDGENCYYTHWMPLPPPPRPDATPGQINPGSAPREDGDA